MRSSSSLVMILVSAQSKRPMRTGSEPLARMTASPSSSPPSSSTVPSGEDGARRQLDAAGAGERSPSGHHLHLARLEQVDDAVAELDRHRLLARHERGEVEAHVADHHAVLARRGAPRGGARRRPPWPWSGCSRGSGRCRRSRAPRPPSPRRRAGRRGRRPRSRRVRRRAPGSWSCVCPSSSGGRGRPVSTGREPAERGLQLAQRRVPDRLGREHHARAGEPLTLPDLADQRLDRQRRARRAGAP